jgi:hypothetical protein
MEASDPVVMLGLSIATRTAAKATLRMRKMPHPPYTGHRIVLILLFTAARDGPVGDIEGQD